MYTISYKQPQTLYEKENTMGSKTKVKKSYKQLSKHGIEEDLLVGFRKRKDQTGIPISRSIDDALRYAMANKGEWWRK